MANACTKGQCDHKPKGRCPRIQRFSNTAYTFGGKTLGKSKESDCARNINLVKDEVAAFYPHKESSLKEPSRTPSVKPSSLPSGQPSTRPTSLPSSEPSNTPTKTPSNSPSSIPSLSFQPSSLPSLSDQPSISPSTKPSISPSLSTRPSDIPSFKPSRSQEPSDLPSSSIHPSGSPSISPSSEPSSEPSSGPTSEPTSAPSTSPSQRPSGAPSPQPAPLRTCSDEKLSFYRDKKGKYIRCSTLKQRDLAKKCPLASVGCPVSSYLKISWWGLTLLFCLWHMIISITCHWKQLFCAGKCNWDKAKRGMVTDTERTATDNLGKRIDNGVENVADMEQ